MSNPTLQAELEQVLHTLWLVFYENSTLTSMADTYYIAELEALKAILATVSKHLPEKKDTIIYKGSYTLDEMGDPINNTHGLAYCNGRNTAITEMEKTLGGVK